MATAAGSITKDGQCWRMAGKGGAVYLWRNAHGLRCSCPYFRQNKHCRHKVPLLQHLSACLEEYAREE